MEDDTAFVCLPSNKVVNVIVVMPTNTTSLKWCVLIKSYDRMIKITLK